MSEPQPSQLDYAPPIAWHQRSSTRRWAIGMAIAIVLLLMIRWTPAIYSHFAMLYWQQQIRSYMAPPDAIVHEWSEAGENEMPLRSAVVPHEWSAFYEHASPPGLQSAGTAFLHAMKASPQSEERLVAVDVVSGQYEGKWIDLQARVFAPGSIGRSPREVGRANLGPEPFVNSARIYSGRLAMNDPSHATVTMELDGKPLEVHVWLLPNDNLLLETGESR